MLGNASEGLYSSAFATIGAMAYMPENYLNFGEIPILSMANGNRSYWVYGLITGFSSLGLSFSQDFVGLWFKNSQYYNSVSKPISAGILGVILAIIFGGFQIKAFAAMRNAFLITLVSNALRQYASNVMFPESMSSASVNIKINEVSNPIIDVMPPGFKDSVFTNGIPDFAGFNSFY